MTTKAICLVGLLVIVGSATGYVVTRRTHIQTSVSPAQLAAPISLPREKVKRNLLPNQLRWALKELGDRLERTGKERRTIAAELQKSDGAAPVQLVQEFPDRLRFVVQAGSSLRVVTFDGNEARALGLPPDLPERDLIESLVYDSPEHFFISQTRRLPVRALGNRFRSDEGLHYDIYELRDAVNVEAVRRVQSKLYYFNSDTQLLEKVGYAIERNGTTIQVETHFADWQTSQQQRCPGRITRVENGNTVWSLLITSADLSPMLDDGIFSTP